MSSSKHRAVRPRRLSAILSGACALAACAGTSQAVTLALAKGFLGWQTWQQNGALGDKAVLAIVEGGLPFPDHQSIAGKVSLELSWPWLNSTIPDDPINIVDRNWYSTHATAVASAIVGDGSLHNITGVAPDVTVIAASFASGIDPSSNSYQSVTNTSLAFALFAVTDKGVADSVADALGVERWRVASVVNASYALGLATVSQRFEGEDPVSRIFNICASMTGATIVCPTGEDGINPILQSHQPQLGTAEAPSTAFNVISVGRTTQDYRTTHPESGGGLLPAIEWAVKAHLIPPDADPLGPPPLPTEPELFEKRPGVNLVAPGTNITLAGSLADPVDAPGAATFSDFWLGTGFSTALVSSAAALVHDRGTRSNLWVTGSPSALVTKAVLINSANKNDVSFNNNAQPDQMTGEIITTQGLDDRSGAGQLDFKRLFNQFFLANVRDYKNIQGFEFDPLTASYSKPATGTDPRIPFVSRNTGIDITYDPGSPAAPRHATGLGVDGGPSFNDDADSSDIIPVARIGLGGDDDPLLGGNPGPSLGGGGSNSGGVGPPPAPESFPGGPTGNPLPPPTPLPPPPTPGQAMFTSGWDSGNIGTGFIDYPIGVINFGSTVTVTLCWNRRETWKTPNFAGPMSFISPDKVFAPGFVNPVAEARAAGAVAAQCASIANVTPRSQKMQFHTIGVDGDCHAGAKHAIIKNADGSRMPIREADAFIASHVQSAMVRQFTPAAEAPRPRGASGLDIQFNFGPTLQTHPDFIAAMNAAASIWESVIQSPVAVTIDVDLDNLGNNVIGATGANFMGFDYPSVRQAMISHCSPEFTTLLSVLPTGSATFTAEGGDFNTDDSDGLLLTSANAKAIGLPTFGGSDGFMLFNSTFPFDTNPSDGITPGTVDLVSIMAHELGHALGFISSVDDDFSDPDSPLGTPTTLDLCRFGINQSSNRPITLADFMSFPREFRAGVECALNTATGVVGVEGSNDFLRFSTGQFQGDFNQSSHWKDNFYLGTSSVIGIMDPTYRGNVFLPGYLSTPDLLAMAVMGWQTDITRPPSGPPGLVPVIDARSLGADATDAPFEFFVSQGGPTTLISTELAFPNLDVEVIPVSFDGIPLVPLASSRTTDNNVEHISVTTGLATTQYIVRVRWTGTRVDLGGYSINSSTFSLPRPGYRNLPEAQVEFGMAWYVDQARLGGSPLTEGLAGDLNADGEVNATDLANLLANYGSNNPSSDLNSDGIVNSADLALLLGNFGSH